MNRILVRGVAVSTLLAAVAFAGPLDPPGGPIAPTNKTLQEVEPRTAVTAANTPGSATALFVISSPGSYYLTGNINGSVGKNGIEIAASGVTLDLNGFDLVGPGSGAAVDGVHVDSGGFANIAIVNGSVRNWTGDGIDTLTGVATNTRVEKIMSSGNAQNGISLCQGSTASRCVVRSNTQHGMFVSGYCTVSDCTVSNNGGNGINCATGCTITACTLALNSTGISTSPSCLVSNCALTGNLAHGIQVSAGSTVTGCNIRGSGYDGILCAASCVVRDNTCDTSGSVGLGSGVHASGVSCLIVGNNCTNADVGITVDQSRSIIMRNTCSGNSTNWSIATGNSVAPIVSAAINSSPISGNTYSGSLGSTDPNANFTY